LRGIGVSSSLKIWENSAVNPSPRSTQTQYSHLYITSTRITVMFHDSSLSLGILIKVLRPFTFRIIISSF
jgi:hypothetical protein